MFRELFARDFHNLILSYGCYWLTTLVLFISAHQVNVTSHPLLRNLDKNYVVSNAINNIIQVANGDVYLSANCKFSPSNLRLSFKFLWQLRYVSEPALYDRAKQKRPKSHQNTTDNCVWSITEKGISCYMWWYFLLPWSQFMTEFVDFHATNAISRLQIDSDM